MMARYSAHRVWLAAALCAAAGVACAQSATQTTPQGSPAPCSVIPQPQPCGGKQADKKSTTDKFPFPGEGTAPAQPGPSAPALTGVPHAPEPAQAPLNPGVPADKRFPFPGADGAPATPDTSGATSSSSASSSSSSSADGDPNPADAASTPDAGSAPELKDKGSEGQQTRHILHRVNPPGTKLQSADEREAEDLDVARSYMDQENFTAAYMRGLDAVKLAPDDPVAHFLVAEAAMKLNKRDEAMQHYQQCLKLDPVDKQAKAARKALEKLEAKR